MKRVNVFGFPIPEPIPDYAESMVALVDALSDYILRLERDADDYETDALAAGEPPNEEEERKFNRHLQAAKLLLKEIQNNEIDPSLGERIKRLRR
jgi:hypothetical protein